MVKEINKKENNTCSKCGKKNIFFRVDGSLFCRACGYDSRSVKK